jgi:hypothetical protein
VSSSRACNKPERGSSDKTTHQVESVQRKGKDETVLARLLGLTVFSGMEPRSSSKGSGYFPKYCIAIISNLNGVGDFGSLESSDALVF